ncbi:MAG: response regulator [Anaerolineae bacterium]|nr:response regulator [Anaerolineae bacterium]
MSSNPIPISDLIEKLKIGVVIVNYNSLSIERVSSVFSELFYLVGNWEGKKFAELFKFCCGSEKFDEAVQHVRAGEEFAVNVIQNRGQYSRLVLKPINKEYFIFEAEDYRVLNGENVRSSQHDSKTIPLPVKIDPYQALTMEAQKRQAAETALKNSQDAIMALYNITSSHTLSYSEKILAMLSLGCQLFNMELGVLSRRQGSENQVIEIYSERFDDVKKQIFEQNNKFCDIVISRDEPYQENLEVKNDESSSKTGFSPKSFMGVPVKVQYEIYGSLLFISSDVCCFSLGTAEQEIMRLMAQWMGTEIERDEYLRQLQNYTGEIENKNIDLTGARDQALELSRLKSEFLATVSHEIRTPMNAVIGMTDLLLHTELNKDQREYAKIVNDSAQLLLKLINDILDFSKIEAGKIVLENIHFDLENAIDSIVDMFAPKVREKGIELIVYVAPDVPKVVNGDPLRLQQVLMNLVGNAVKFTNVGHVHIRVSVEAFAGQNVTLHFTVEDTGIGVSKEVQAILFQPFTQADGSTTRKYGGTGLGLAISKRLVELMDGEIGLDDERDGGASFWFNLKFGAVEHELNEPLSLNEAGAASVLVIEKNPVLKDVIYQYIKDWGVDVYSLANIGDAIRLLKSNVSLDIILLDISNMTRLEMFKFDQAAKELDHFFNVKMVFITSLEQKGTREFGGMNLAFRLIKPIKRAALFEVLKGAVTSAIPSAPDQVFNNEPAEAFQDAPDISDVQFVFERNTRIKDVLVAEDNPANQRLTVLQLAKLGFNGISVSDGREALDMIMQDSSRFKFVLMDCQMPGMDGLTAATKIRDFEFTRGSHVPIIAMTGNASNEDRVACIKAGMDEYISKPVDMEKLKEVIRRVLPDGQLEKGSGPLQRRLTTGELFPLESQDTLDSNIIAGIRQLQIEGQPDVLTELIDLYFRDSKSMLLNIRKLIKGRDGAGLKRLAHSFKGASANVGARKLAALLAVLEDQALSENFAAANETATKIEVEYMNTFHALEKERKIS